MSSHSLASDLRHTWRHARAHPSLPMLAFGILAVGIAMGTAVFATAYAALWRPLPFPSQDRLMVVTSAFPGMRLRAMGLSGPEASELGSLTTSFARVGFGWVGTTTLSSQDVVSSGQVARVSADLLQALQPIAIEGRLFTPAEDLPAGSRVAIVTESLRRTFFAGDATVVGRLIGIDGLSHEIVGVLGSDVTLAGQRPDLWVPLQYDVRAPTSNRSNHAFTVVGRLADDVTDAAAREDLRVATERWIATTGQFHSPSPQFHPLSMTPLVEVVRGPVRPATFLLLGAVSLLLLIAAANAAALLMVHADRRRPELAVRAALGATRSRLWRLLSVDAAVLAAASAAAGWGAAWALGRLIESLAPPAIATLGLVLPAWQSAALAIGVAVMTTGGALVAAGSRIPASRLTTELNADGRTDTSAPSRQRSRQVLVTAEIALALGLSGGAAFMAESFWRLTSVAPGFTPASVLRGFLDLPSTVYPPTDRDRIDGFYDQLAASLLRRPRVQSVGFMSGLPPERRPNNTSVTAEGQSVDVHTGVPPVQFLQFVTPGVFETLGIRLKAGRLFADSDRRDSMPVAIVNERAAAAFFPNRPAIGGRMRMFMSDTPWMTVVGVVADMRQAGLAQPPGTELFVPVSQARNAGGGPMARDLNVVIRTASRPDDLAGPLRDAVKEIDARVAISRIETMETVVGRSVAAPRFLTAVLVSFAIVALVLSASGVGGLVMHAVATRTREIGVRRSLGASNRSLASLVLGQVAGLIAVGVVLGLGLALAGSRALNQFAFEASASNPWRLGFVALTLTSAALFACVVPLVRALRIDPIRALRQ